MLSHMLSFMVMQTMGGEFSGKEQDATNGIYVLAGKCRVFPGWMDEAWGKPPEMKPPPPLIGSGHLDRVAG